MQRPDITTLQRTIAGAVALFAMTVSFAVCLRGARVGNKRGLWIGLGSYGFILLAAFFGGVLFDDGFGWAFLPLMVITAPWSFFVAAPISRIFDEWGLSKWTGPFLMNFLLLVVVCGGLNMLLFYFLVKKIAYPGKES